MDQMKQENEINNLYQQSWLNHKAATESDSHSHSNTTNDTSSLSSTKTRISEISHPFILNLIFERFMQIRQSASSKQNHNGYNNYMSRKYFFHDDY